MSTNIKFATLAAVLVTLSAQGPVSAQNYFPAYSAATPTRLPPRRSASRGRGFRPTPSVRSMPEPPSADPTPTTSNSATGFSVGIPMRAFALKSFATRISAGTSRRPGLSRPTACVARRRPLVCPDTARTNEQDEMNMTAFPTKRVSFSVALVGALLSDGAAKPCRPVPAGHRPCMEPGQRNHPSQGRGGAVVAAELDRPASTPADAGFGRGGRGSAGRCVAADGAGRVPP